MFRLIDSLLADPNDGLGLDTALFRALEEDRSGEALHLWESQQPAVIVGALAAIRHQVHEQACVADKVPVLRRISGGGAVLVGHGCLNYSLVLSLEARPELRPVERSYRLIMNRIVKALGISGLAVRGLGDLAIGERKVAGCAQRRGRRTLLHHGTVLYDFDIQRMERYLKEPERCPAYRAGRRHARFVTNAPLGPEAIKESIARAWLPWQSERGLKPATTFGINVGPDCSRGL